MLNTQAAVTPVHYIWTTFSLKHNSNTDDTNPNASGGFFEMHSLKLIVFT